MSNQSYRINQPAVIAEVIDGEAIIVNLDSGTYYSLCDSGCAVWELLVQQMTVPDVVQNLASRYSSVSSVIEAGVTALLTELLNEQLLLPAEGAPAAAPALVHADGHQPFPPPVLDKFTDMTDLLLLDPIHEVDTQGWPHAASGR